MTDRMSTIETCPPVSSSDFCSTCDASVTHVKDDIKTDDELQKLKELKSLLINKYIRKRPSVRNKKQEISKVKVKAVAKLSSSIDTQGPSSNFLPTQKRMMYSPYTAIEETVKQLSIPTNESYENQIIKMRVLGMTQEKVIKSYILLRRRNATNFIRAMYISSQQTQDLNPLEINSFSCPSNTMNTAYNNELPYQRGEETGINHQNNKMQCLQATSYMHEQYPSQSANLMANIRSTGEQSYCSRGLESDNDNRIGGSEGVSTDEKIILPAQSIQEAHNSQSSLTFQQKQILTLQKRQWQTEFDKWNSDKNSRCRMYSEATNATEDVSRKCSYVNEANEAQEQLERMRSINSTSQDTTGTQMEVDQTILSGVNETLIVKSDKKLFSGGTNVNNPTKIVSTDDFFSYNDNHNAVDKIYLYNNDHNTSMNTNEDANTYVDRDKFVQHYMNLGEDHNILDSRMYQEHTVNKLFDD